MKRKNILQEVLHKIRFGINIIKIYKTWPEGFMDYFKFLSLIKRNKIIHRLRNGNKYIIRTGTNDFGIINEIYIVKEYNQLMGYLKQNSVVIDIGAQIGVFSVFAGKIAKKGLVLSYEPFTENFEMLNQNIKLNSLENLKAFKKGISGKSGKRELVISEENTGGHSLFESGGKKVEIQTITLEQVFKENKLKKCDYLKIDCEGAEYEILMNTPIAYLKKIKSISMEYHDNGNVEELKNFLEKSGFKVEIGILGEGMLYAWR